MSVNMLTECSPLVGEHAHRMEWWWAMAVSTVEDRRWGIVYRAVSMLTATMRMLTAMWWANKKAQNLHRRRWACSPHAYLCSPHLFKTFPPSCDDIWDFKITFKDNSVWSLLFCYSFTKAFPWNMQINKTKVLTVGMKQVDLLKNMKRSKGICLLSKGMST